MTKILDLKMATVIEEEDFENEEYEVSECFENYENKRKTDGPSSPKLETISSRSNADSSDDDDSDDTENNRSSVVENDEAENAALPAVIINSVRRNGADRGAGTPVPNYSLEVPKEPDICVSPLSSPEQHRSRRFVRAMTLSMKDKYVTELCFLHPDSTSGNKMISLGIFVATSLRYGDHSIYKISPISPLKVLPLQPQDRIVKINNISVCSWSHNSVVNFVRCLSHSEPPKEIPDSASTGFTFSLEYVPYAKTATSPDQGPTREEITLSVTISNGRMVLGCFSSSAIQIRPKHITTQEVVKRFGSNKYLSVDYDPVGSTPENTDENRRLRVTAKPRVLSNNHTCLTFHDFEMTPTEAGRVVIIETFRPGHFLHFTSNLSGTTLSVMVAMEGSDLSNVTNSRDSRLFRIISDPGDDRVKIIHIATGLYLKEMGGTVRLVSSPASNHFPKNMLFQMYPYTD